MVYIAFEILNVWNILAENDHWFVQPDRIGYKEYSHAYTPALFISDRV